MFYIHPSFLHYYSFVFVNIMQLKHARTHARGYFYARERTHPCRYANAAFRSSYMHIFMIEENSYRLFIFPSCCGATEVGQNFSTEICDVRWLISFFIWWRWWKLKQIIKTPKFPEKRGEIMIGHYVMHLINMENTFKCSLRISSVSNNN